MTKPKTLVAIQIARIMKANHNIQKRKMTWFSKVWTAVPKLQLTKMAEVKASSPADRSPRRAETALSTPDSQDALVNFHKHLKRV